MVSRPLGPALPLQMLGRADTIVMRDGIVRCIVQVVSPLVDVVRPWLDDLLSANIGHAQRCQHAHRFVRVHFTEVLGHQGEASEGFRHRIEEGAPRSFTPAAVDRDHDSRLARAQEILNVIERVRRQGPFPGDEDSP